MAKIISHSVEENGIEYVFEIELKNYLRSLLKASDGEESFTTVLTAKFRPVPVPGETPEPWEPVSAEIEFKFAPDNDRAVLSVEGEFVAEIPMQILLNANETAPVEDDAGFLTQVCTELDPSDTGKLDAAIQALPTDPILGCILKSGISATLRQATLCYQTTRTAESALAKAQVTLKCLGENAGKILGRMGGRTLLCVMSAGLG